MLYSHIVFPDISFADVNAEALKMLERVQMVVRMVNGNGAQMGAPPQQHLAQKSNLMKSMAQNNSSSYFDGLDSTWVRTTNTG